MTFALWSVLIAAILPYLFTGLAKAGGPQFDNAAPRAWLERQQGWPQRAHWAQLNSFEAFPPFAAAVIIAHMSGATQWIADFLAAGFLGFRVLYGAFYILNMPTVRSIVWTGAFACVIGLFVASALATGN